jgi:hypothetical protein
LILLKWTFEPSNAGLQSNALSIKNTAMILHHIKPEQFSQLEKIYGKKTNSGLEIPDWLRRLKDTAMTPKHDDFEVTVPGGKPLPKS